MIHAFTRPYKDAREKNRVDGRNRSGDSLFVRCAVVGAIDHTLAPPSSISLSRTLINDFPNLFIPVPVPSSPQKGRESTKKSSPGYVLNSNVRSAACWRNLRY